MLKYQDNTGKESMQENLIITMTIFTQSLYIFAYNDHPFFIYFIKIWNNSYINVPSPYRSGLSSIITAKIKFLALSLKAIKKNQFYFSCFTARKTRLSKVPWFTQECPSLFWLLFQKQGILNKNSLRVWEHDFCCKDWIQLIRSNYYA